MGRSTKTPILVQSRREFIQKVQLERKENKMETQFSPQIFVIPQKMLQQQQKQSLLKIATTTPTLAPAAPKYRVILSDSNKTNKILVNDKIQIAKSKPMAAVVGCKRPAEPEPGLSPSIKSEEDEDDEICGTPMRKRANLDHLSPEERLQRRKLKNRVAAQNARDKKKAQTEEMEKLIEDMRAEKQKFAEENARLQAFNTQLQIENASLLKENKEYKQELGIISQNQTESQEIHIELPMSPDSLPPMSPSSSSPSSPVSVSSLASPRSSPMVPPESAAGAGYHDTTDHHISQNRVVVARLDSLGTELCGHNVLSSYDVYDDIEAVLAQTTIPVTVTTETPAPSTTSISVVPNNQVAIEEEELGMFESTSPKNLTEFQFLTCSNQDTEIEQMLANNEYNLEAKWNESLEDILFPDLD